MVTLKALKSGHNKGTATVEAAFVFPVLLLLIFGAIHYGWLFMRANQIANAARQGVRAAIVDGDVTGAVAIVMTKAGLSTGDYVMSISPGYINFPAGDPVTVQVTVSTANSKIGLVNIPMLPTPTQLRASVTMAKEGP